MKTEEIRDVLAQLHKITGFRVSLHDADYGEISAYPKEKSSFCQMLHKIPQELETCALCDKQVCKRALAQKGTHIYTCRYGFTEAVSPLYNFGILTGFLMMGQVFEIDENGTRRHYNAKGIAALGENFTECTRHVPNVPSDMVEAYVKIMTICAQYLTLSNAVSSGKKSTAELAKKYIHDNFRSKLGISEICREIGCSKSSLSTSFKKQYGTTVNDYIQELRLAEAVNMLSLGEGGIGEIALACGFSDQSYFSKVFSAKYGIPPSEYKKGQA